MMPGTEIRMAPEGKFSALAVGPDPRGVAPVILVVEDDAIIGQFVALILSKVGYTTLRVTSALEALRLCAEHTGPIDLLLTDIMLPELNGYLLASQICSTRPETRVLYISGYEEEYLHSLAGSKDQILLLEKPFVTQSLLYKVQGALQGAPRSERKP